MDAPPPGAAAPAAAAADGAFRARVEAYYREHNPARLSLVDEIVAKYAGREEALWAKLAKKYDGAATAADRVDFRSRNFDALAALRTPGVAPPVPSARPLDNVHKFRPFLPASSGERDDRVKQSAHHAPRPEPDASASSRGAELLRAVTDPLRDGPHGVLWRALRDRAAVKVVLRRVNCIRGSCVGLLKAFDRHMNLVLVDAAETTVPPMRNPDRARPVTRFLKQVLIRGDNVVLVCRAPNLVGHDRHQQRSKRGPGRS